MENADRSIRLFTLNGCCRKSNILLAWWIIPQFRHIKSNKVNRKSLRCSPWRTDVWSSMVWPWWETWLGCFSQRSWLYIWLRCCRVIFTKKRVENYSKSSLISYDCKFNIPKLTILINRDSIGLRIKKLLQSLVLQIIVTDVDTKQV